jgi:mono/diheme cytochrome c family protein
MTPIKPALALALLAAAPAHAATDAVFSTQCAMCHQSAAQGIPGQFPQLAGRAGQIAATPRGRHYLVHTVLNGLTGAIQVNGATIAGYMPGFRTASDGDVAAALNFLIALPGAKSAPFTPAEVAKVRAEGPAGSALSLAERKQLAADHLIP